MIVFLIGWRLVSTHGELHTTSIQLLLIVLFEIFICPAQLTICASKPSTNQKIITNGSFGTGEICCKVVGLYVNSPAALIDDCRGLFCIAGMEGGTEICDVKPNAVTFLLQLSLLYRSWWVGLHFINLLKDMSAKLCKTLQSRLYAKTLNHNPTLETFRF